MTEPKQYTVLAFDPGYATGVAAGSFEDDKPLRLDDATIIPYDHLLDAVPLFEQTATDHLVVEKFELTPGNSFAPDLHAVKVEGLLEYAFEPLVPIKWRSPSDKHQVSDELLQSLGWWKTGADVDWEDGRDANDAIIHMLGYVAFTLRHQPTLWAYFR